MRRGPLDILAKYDRVSRHDPAIYKHFRNHMQVLFQQHFACYICCDLEKIYKIYKILSLTYRSIYSSTGILYSVAGLLPRSTSFLVCSAEK